MKLSNKWFKYLTEVFLIGIFIFASGNSFAALQAECAPAGSTNCYLQDSAAPVSAVVSLQTKIDIFRTDPSLPAPTPAEIEEIKVLIQEARDKLANAGNSYILKEPADLKIMPPGFLAPILAEILIEPNHTLNFRNLLEGKSFYQNLTNTGSTPPANSEIAGLVALGSEGSYCNSNFNKCGSDLICVEADINEPAGCFGETSFCASNSECCSGSCSNGLCASANKCNSGMIAYTEFTDPTINCANGLTKESFIDTDSGTTIYQCIDESYAGDADIPNQLGDFDMDKVSCSPIIKKSVLDRFKANERILLAFEVVFSNTKTYDHFDFLKNFQVIAKAFAKDRIDSKRTYEKILNEMLSEQKREIAAIEEEAQNGGRLTFQEQAKPFQFYVEENKAIMAKELARHQAYPKHIDDIEKLITRFQGLKKGKWKSWGKKRWFKKNMCGKYAIPFIRSKNHRKCSRVIADGNTGAIGNMESYLRDLAVSIKTVGCQMDPVSTRNYTGKKNSIGGKSYDDYVTMFSSILDSYAKKPIGNGAGQHPEMKDLTINLNTERNLEDGQGGYTDQKVTLREDLIKIIGKTALAYGSGATCRNPAPGRRYYAKAVIDAIKEVAEFYKKSADLKKDKIIPCFEARVAQLEDKCIPGLPAEEGGCEVISPEVDIVETCEPGTECDTLSNANLESLCEDGDDCPEFIQVAEDDSINPPTNSGDISEVGFNPNNNFGGESAITSGTTEGGSDGSNGVSLGSASASVNGDATTGSGAFGKVNSSNKDSLNLDGQNLGNSFAADGSSGTGINANIQTDSNGNPLNGGSLNGNNSAQGGQGSGSRLSAKNKENKKKQEVEKPNKVLGTNAIAIGKSRRRANGSGINKIFDPFGSEIDEDSYDEKDDGNFLGGSLSSDSVEAQRLMIQSESNENKGLSSDNIFTRVTKTYKREALPIFLIKEKAKKNTGEIEFERSPAEATLKEKK